MDDSGLLAQVVIAVRGVQSAFQNLCSAIHVCNSEEPCDLLALEVSLQSLGTIIEILDSIDTGGGQLDLSYSILATPNTVSTSGGQISVVDAMIVDMHNLEQRLIDVRREIATAHPSRSSAPAGVISLGEAMRIRGMIEKYHSIITEVMRGQTMCVIMLWAVMSVLTSSSATTNSMQSSINDTMEVIMNMRAQMEEYKQMDTSLIPRALISRYIEHRK
jgi:hypothetical protein